MWVRARIVNPECRPERLFNMDLIERVAPHGAEPERVRLYPPGWDDDEYYLVEGSLGFWETLLRVGRRGEY